MGSIINFKSFDDVKNYNNNNIDKNTIASFTYKSLGEVGQFINASHEVNYWVCKVTAFKSVVSVKDSKISKFKNYVETRVGHVGARPKLISKRIGLNKYEINVNLDCGPSTVASKNFDGLKELAEKNCKSFYTTVFTDCGAKMLTFEMEYEIDSIVNDAQVQRGKEYVAMTDEWRRKIGDGHRGQKYKTRALEGITWKWGTIGKKKVKLLIEK